MNKGATVFPFLVGLFLESITFNATLISFRCDSTIRVDAGVAFLMGISASPWSVSTDGNLLKVMVCLKICVTIFAGSTSP